VQRKLHPMPKSALALTCAAALARGDVDSREPSGKRCAWRVDGTGPMPPRQDRARRTDVARSSGPSDHSLLRQTQEGWAEASALLYRRYARRLRAVVWSKTFPRRGPGTLAVGCGRSDCPLSGAPSFIPNSFGPNRWVSGTGAQLASM
jgi:hypothetical protein